MRLFGLNDFLFILSATRWTILLSLLAFALGGLLGAVIAVLRISRFSAVRLAAASYVQLFQGTPLLMQLFLIYYGLSLFGLRLDAWTAVTIAYTIYAAAFLGDIWRGCIQAIPKEQWEASRALALGYAHQLFLVIMPQAVRIAIPPTVGFLVQLVKATAVASIIGFVELTRAGQLMTNATFQPMIVYPIVAVLYLSLCWPLSVWAQHLEKRFRVENVMGRRK
ncbi:MAG: amino acid ABC transporter permease [Alphaproteobacteria bacterium]|nr:MAG: amino acid ABC transporter permease [Alphaproteobacteria bacterium]